MWAFRGRFEHAGKVAARLDDFLNLVPARATALLLLVGGLLQGRNVRRGLTMLWRDGARTESPNAGRPMATMAGLFGGRPRKNGGYALGAPHSHPPTRKITAAPHILS